MSDLLESLGSAVSPVGGAVDFLTPSATPQGQGFDLGALMGSIGQGATDVVREGPGAIAGGLKAAFDPNSGASARERLLIGGITAVGGGLLAREAHMAWKRSLTPDILMRGAPSGTQNLVDLGDTRRFTSDLSITGELAHQRYPGLHPRQAEIMGAVDYDGVIHGLRRWDPEDAVAESHGRAVFDRYVSTVGSAETAQVDWARFDQAVERGVFAYEQNASIRKLWNKVTSSPQSLSAKETDEILGVVREVSAATEAAGHDLSFGIVGRIERIDMSPEGPIIYTRQPVGWTDGTANGADVRTERLRQLNYRNLAERGKGMVKSLYERGIADWQRPAGTPSRLPAELEVGPDWYPSARNDVADVFGLERADSDELQRAVAAVSFLSEAEDWSTNIVKAHRVMTNPTVVEPLSDPDFLYWITKPSAYSGGRRADHQEVFNRIHEHVRSSGFKVSQSDLGVILRLQGAQESVQQIFASTERRKQRNFFLNIYHPELEAPVTIDRHAFDAFLGLDSGINDRPIDMSLFDGDQVYDVVADTYRSLATELNVKPHELQAVVWETWRALKSDPYTNAAGKTVGRRGGWAHNDPYMLPEADGSTNLVYEALNGRGLDFPIEGAQSLPASVLEAGAGDLSSAALPNGSVAYIAEISDDAVSKLRHLYPAVIGKDHVPRWAPTRPTPVRSVREVSAGLLDTGAHGEGLLISDVQKIGGHPALTPGEVVTFDIPDGAPVPRGRWQATELGRVSVDEAEHSLRHLAPEDLDPKTFVNPETSPLATHQWAALAAGEGMDRKLIAEMKRKGYHPIRQEGTYTMDDGSVVTEPSYLAFGMSASEAQELGAKYSQESVLITQGLLYSDGTNRFVPSEGLDFGMQSGDRTVLGVGGEEVAFSMRLDFRNDPDPFEPASVINRTTRTRRKVSVKLPERSRQNIAEVAEELEAKGATNVSVYSHQPSIEGWTRASESVYSDGVQVYSVRSGSAPVTSPNSGPVFVRSADGLPSDAPAVSPVIADPEAMVSGSSVVSADELDVMPALEQAALLRQSGQGPSDLSVGGRKFALPTEPKKLRSQTILLKNGRTIPSARRDSGLNDEFGFEADFGFEFDPRFRVGNKVEQLDDLVIRNLRDITQIMEGGYGEAMRRFRLSRVTVSPGNPKHFAQMEWKPGGAIVLTRDWWSDIPKMVDQIGVQRARGDLARGAAVSPESILVHEYGHVIHAAIRLAEGWGKSSRFEKEIMKHAKLSGLYDWRLNAQNKISMTAGEDVSELVAESFSEVMTGTPAPLSRLVVDLTDEFLEDSLKYRKVVGL